MLSSRITEALEKLIGSPTGPVLSYWPVASSAEVNITPLNDRLLARGVTIGLPVVTDFSRSGADQRLPDPPVSRIETRRFEAGSVLSVNQWSINEPLSGTLIPPGEFALAIVPALGAGRNMYRIGNGYGYYDELLAQMDCKTVCPVYSECVIDDFPVDPHDIPVDYLVTEHEIIGANAAL